MFLELIGLETERCLGRRDTSLSGGGESDLRVAVVEHRVVLAHEHIPKDPEGACRLGHVHAHDRENAELVVAGLHYVLIALQCVLLREGESRPFLKRGQRVMLTR